MSATTDLGKVGITVNGTWSDSVAYEKNSIVNDGADSYISIQDVPIGTALSNTAYWTLLCNGFSSAEVVSAVNAWLDDHPEATTTVQDGSITLAKLASDIHNDVAELPAVKSLLTIPLVQGHYINVSGEYAGPSDAFSVTDYCPFSNKDKFELIGFNNSAWASYCLGYAFYDSNKTFISGDGDFDGNLSSSSITIPLNTAYVRFSTRTQYATSAEVYISYLNGTLNELSREIDSKNYISDSDVLVVSENMFDPTKITTGKEVYADGSIRINSNSAVTDYIDVSLGNGTLYLSGLAQYEATGLTDKFYAFYDEDKTVVSTGTVSNTLTATQLTIPEGAKYFVISVYQRADNPQTVDYSTFMVSFKNQPYVPYSPCFGGLEGLPVVNVAGNNPTTKGMSILIFGDSITETATVSDDGTSYVEGTRSNWPKFAKGIMQLGTMVNFAKSGAAYKDRAGVEERQKISVQISSAISSGRTGQIIVISAGTNDGDSSIGSYETAMSKPTLDSLDRTNLYEAIRWAMWKIRSTYKDAICFAATPIQRADREPIQDLRNAIIRMANRYDFIVIDAGSESGIIRENQVWEAEGNDLYDGLHPNINGQKKMANLYSSVIMRNIP